MSLNPTALDRPQRRRHGLLHALQLAAGQRHGVVKVDQRFQQRPQPSSADGSRRTGARRASAEKVHRFGQLAQRLGVLFLLRPHRPRLQVDLLPQGRELADQRVQIDCLPRGGSSAGPAVAAAVSQPRKSSSTAVIASGVRAGTPGTTAS